MLEPPSSVRTPALAYAEIATGVGIVVFWLLFFTVGMAPAKPPACYFAFEHAFPPPDLILASALIAAGSGALRGRAWAAPLSLACAGGLLFLGIIDLSFTAQNGGFSGPIGETIESVAISLWCIVMGLRIYRTHGAVVATAGS
jgi:hypothetical protein